MAGKTVLGKSLGGLLSDSLAAFQDDGDAAGPQLRHLALTAIQPGRLQPRQHIAPQTLSELAESIRAQGVVQPIVVRPLTEGDYEIIAGERRYRAAKIAGLSEIPAIVREMNDETALVCALVENIQRQDLNPIDTARALARLIDEFQLTHQELAKWVGKSRVAVTNALRLLSLSDPVQTKLAAGEIDVGHAKLLLPLPPAQQESMAEEIVRKGLSVRQTEQRVQTLTRPTRALVAPAVDASAYQHWLRTFAERLGCKVDIKPQADGKGRLVIHYDSLDKLRSLLNEE